MLKENLELISGVVDVSILVMSHFENPAKIPSLNFIKKVLRSEIRAIIPTTAFLGAYHILTRYLKVPKKEARDAIVLTLSTKSKAIYEDVSIMDSINAIDHAAIYGIESWDGYLVSLAKKFGARIIYTIDKHLQKVEGIHVVNPVPEDVLNKYHQFIKNLIK